MSTLETFSINFTTFGTRLAPPNKSRNQEPDLNKDSGVGRVSEQLKQKSATKRIRTELDATMRRRNRGLSTLPPHVLPVFVDHAG